MVSLNWPNSRSFDQIYKIYLIYNSLNQLTQYVNWSACPKYKVFTLKQLLDNHQTLLDEYTYARVKLDISISYEEANFIREKFAEQYNVRELQLIPIKEEEEYEGGDIVFESVNQIVIQQLETIESQTIEKQKLIDIYNEIETQ